MFPFRSFPVLTDGEIDLVVAKTCPPTPENGMIPSYACKLTTHTDKVTVGDLTLRIAPGEQLPEDGNLSVFIKMDNRGNGYAAKACGLVKKIAEAHRMERLDLHCSPGNTAACRTCEKIGAQLAGMIDLSPDSAAYKRGERRLCVYRWYL